MHGLARAGRAASTPRAVRHRAGGSPWSAIPNSAVGRALGLPGLRPRGPSGGELGRPPDPYTRAVLESVTRRDLGDVRVHSGPLQDAVLDAHGVDALAHGRDLAIRHEHDHAGTPAGRGLLLHELVHLLQQRGPNGLGDRSPGHDQEEQAREVAEVLVHRPPMPFTGPVAGPAG